MTAAPRATGRGRGVGPRVSTSNLEVRNIPRMGCWSRGRPDACVRLLIAGNAPPRPGRPLSSTRSRSETQRPLATSRLAPRTLEAGGRGVTRDVAFCFDSPPPLSPYIRLRWAFALAQVDRGVGSGRLAAAAVGELEGRGRLGRVSAPRRW